MNRNNFWRFFLVVVIVLWSLYELYPPSGRDLLEVSRERAVQKDATFSNIVYQAQALRKEMPERAYDNIVNGSISEKSHEVFPPWGGSSSATASFGNGYQGTYRM